MRISCVATVLTTLSSTLLTLLLLRALLRRRRYRALERGAVALITGGGSGLGRELALCFARAGCCVLLVGRNVTALQRTASDCRAAGAPEAQGIVADLCTDAGVQHVATRARELCDAYSHSTAGREARVGGVKYLVLNAGAGAIMPFSSAPAFVDACAAMMAINYFANVRLLQQFLPQLTATHRATSPSRVLVISSLAGVLPSILRSPYTASKHALQGFMNALRGETCVPITLCCPGYVDTDFHARVLTAPADAHDSGGGSSDTNKTVMPPPQQQQQQATDAASGMRGPRRGVPAAQCARACVEAALHSDAEALTLEGRLGYALRPVATSLIDYLAKRKSLRSLQHRSA